jgi:hypothetical protein
MQLDQSQLDELAKGLFLKFSRMEYALKQAGFLRKGIDDAMPDWDAFGLTIQKKLEADEKLKAAVDYMKNDPPKAQKVENGEMVWRAIPRNGNSTIELLNCVKRVRNNLFHGGKRGHFWNNPQRDGDLMQHSMDIVDGCLRASNEVRSKFEDG